MYNIIILSKIKVKYQKISKNIKKVINKLYYYYYFRYYFINNTVY